MIGKNNFPRYSTQTYKICENFGPVHIGQNSYETSNSYWNSTIFPILRNSFPRDCRDYTLFNIFANFVEVCFFFFILLVL